MKKIRIILSVVAFVSAMGGAIASSRIIQNPVYEWIDVAGTANDRCRAVDLECNTTAIPACKLSASGPTFRESSNVSTMCGQELHRPN